MVQHKWHKEYCMSCHEQQFFGHEWGDLPMIFTSDQAKSENRWQITSEVTKKSLFMVTYVLFHFLHAILCPEYTIPINTIIDCSFRHCAKEDIFYLALWHHHSWSMASRESKALALWRHIRWLFLHLQIGGKAIFTSEWQPWTSISHHPVFMAKGVWNYIHPFSNKGKN